MEKKGEVAGVTEKVGAGRNQKKNPGEKKFARFLRPAMFMGGGKGAGASARNGLIKRSRIREKVIQPDVPLKSLGLVQLQHRYAVKYCVIIKK